MNKDQVKGAAKDAAGKVQQKAGDMVGNHKQETKGLANKPRVRSRSRLAMPRKPSKTPTSKSGSTRYLSPLWRAFAFTALLAAVAGWLIENQAAAGYRLVTHTAPLDKSAYFSHLAAPP